MDMSRGRWEGERYINEDDNRSQGLWSFTLKDFIVILVTNYLREWCMGSKQRDENMSSDP